jgi:hypothetical protein
MAGDQPRARGLADRGVRTTIDSATSSDHTSRHGGTGNTGRTTTRGQHPTNGSRPDQPDWPDRQPDRTDRPDRTAKPTGCNTTDINTDTAADCCCGACKTATRTEAVSVHGRLRGGLRHDR